MTPKSLWTIMVKIFGLYLLWQCLAAIFQMLGLFMANSSPENGLPQVVVVLWITGVFAFFCWLVYKCIFSTAWIIEKLKLEEGFSEEIFELNIHRSTVLTIATIVIGGIILIESIPQACVAIFDYFTRDGSYTTHVLSTYSFWAIVDVLKVALGYFMVSESRMIVNFIERKRKSPVDHAKE